MSQQKQVRELFALPKKEVIFDDFGCALRSGIIHHGRMYLTENYICFYSSLMGINKKIIIPLVDIAKMTKVKSMGIFNSLQIYQQGKPKPYKFSSFTDCDSTFKIINKLWGNVSPHAKDPDAVSEEEDPDTNQSSNGDLNQASTIIDQGLIASAPSVEKEQLTNPEIKASQSQAQGVQIIIEEEKPDSQVDVNNERSKSANDIKPLNLASPPLQEELKENDKPPALQLQEKVRANSMHQAHKHKEEEHYTKEDLEKLLEPYPTPENYTEILRQCFSVSAKDFLQNFITESSPMSMLRFLTERGETKIVSQPWTEPDPAEEYDSMGVLLASQINVDMTVKGNPFIKVAPSNKYFKVLEMTDTKINMRILTKCTGVPYADSFACEEDMLILSPTPTANCCIYRNNFQVIFYKSTMFKGKIISNSVKGGLDFWTEWVEWMVKKGYSLKEKKVPQNLSKLTHGIEKSSKLFEKDKKDDQAEEAKQPQKKLTPQEKALVILRQAQIYAKNNRTEVILMVVLFFMVLLYFKMCRIENLLIQQQQHLHKY